MIVLAESVENLPPSASNRDLKANIEAARYAGADVYTIPPDFTLCETAENALWQVPGQKAATPGIWIGYIPDYERYQAIYNAAQAKNISLLNTPEQHRRAQEFDAAYPFLEGITPRSITVNALVDCKRAGSNVGYPVFVKGAVQSRKARGWKACVAENEDELLALCSTLFELEQRSRGRVVIRELVKLRHIREHNGFPLGREYRVFLLNGNVIAKGYYWEGEDELSALSPAECDAIELLAQEAAKRLNVTYLSIDIGQTEDGDWIVIETGDPQFSGLSQINPLELWARLRNTLSPT